MFTNKASKNNTQLKFKAQLLANEQSLGIRSFETASGLLRKTGTQLKQTKLSLCQKDKKLIYSGFVEEPIKINKPKNQFVYMPAVKMQNCAQNQKETTKIEPKIEPQATLPTTSMSKPGRNLLSLIGRVDFCIKMQRREPKFNAIWNVYGKLLRIIVGKRDEHTLLLRNDEHGPILQSIFYDFQGELKSLTNGCYLLVVGRFISVNRLNTFSVTQVSSADWQQNFSRIENVTSYILMQNTIQK